jgi:hypothetical protein
MATGTSLRPAAAVALHLIAMCHAGINPADRRLAVSRAQALAVTLDARQLRLVARWAGLPHGTVTDPRKVTAALRGIADDHRRHPDPFTGITTTTT